MAQINYQLIAQDARMHRSIVQRVITEMLQRLAMSIVSGASIKVHVQQMLLEHPAADFAWNHMALFSLTLACFNAYQPLAFDKQLGQWPAGNKEWH